MSFSEQQFLDQIKTNAVNSQLLRMLPALGLPQAMLTAGCLFQTIWNVKSGKDPAWAIKDYDLFYFDAADLSFEAEDAVVQRVRTMLGSLADKVEVKNQARVHLWYPEKFGAPYPPLTRVEDGIDRYLVACTRIGIRVDSGKTYAPDGFDDMWDGILRMNAGYPQPELFKRKCQDYQARWPWLVLAP